MKTQPTLSLHITPYQKLLTRLPSTGRHFVAQSQDGLLVFYAAFHPSIAEHALQHQRFGGPFSFNRMTWIKPGFLWMMFRSGWATKPNQERVLAIFLKKEDALHILRDGVLSSYNEEEYGSRATWQERLTQSDVRIQWDPDHDPHGNKLERKAIQIGIRGKMLQRYNEEFIQRIEDVTPLIVEQRERKSNLAGPYLLVPDETVVDFGERLVGQ